MPPGLLVKVGGGYDFGSNLEPGVFPLNGAKSARIPPKSRRYDRTSWLRQFAKLVTDHCSTQAPSLRAPMYNRRGCFVRALPGNDSQHLTFKEAPYRMDLRVFRVLWA